MLTETLSMIDYTDLKNQPISDTDKYQDIENKPTVLYGVLIDNAYDDKRLLPSKGKYYKHTVFDRHHNTSVDLHFCGVKLTQSLLAMILLNKIKEIEADDNFNVVYSELLNTLGISCDESIGDLHEGCLPVDGQHVDKLADEVEKNILNYNLSKPGWFLRFASLNVYVLY
jgi:hypothetical protein